MEALRVVMYEPHVVGCLGPVPPSWVPRQINFFGWSKKDRDDDNVRTYKHFVTTFWSQNPYNHPSPLRIIRSIVQSHDVQVGFEFVASFQVAEIV